MTIRRYVPYIVVGVIAAALAISLSLIFTSGPATETITAQFSEAPGLYPGNHVEVLGIPVGSITSIKSGPDYVTVTMHVDKSTKIPADAGAAIIAPQVVADRAVSLIPAYTSGPIMQAGAVIPVSRTNIPQSVDAVISSLNSLAQQLGPNGANKNGALTTLLHKVATEFSGTGQDFNGSVTNLSKALDVLAQYAPQEAQLFNNAGGLTQALANNSNAYASLTNNLASVGSLLANDRSDVAAVLSSLQQLFANLNTFIQADGSKIGTSVENLEVFAHELASQQAQLAKVFDLSPLVLQNLDNAIDKNAPGGPAIRGRYNALPDTKTLFDQVCGNPTLRFLVLLATGTQTNPLTPGNTVDTLCGVGNAVNALTPPPGAPAGPDLSLKSLVPTS